MTKYGDIKVVVPAKLKTLMADAMATLSEQYGDGERALKMIVQLGEGMGLKEGGFNEDLTRWAGIRPDLAGTWVLVEGTASEDELVAVRSYHYADCGAAREALLIWEARGLEGSPGGFDSQESYA